MANWKRLNLYDAGTTVDVNMDRVAFMFANNAGGTELHISGSPGLFGDECVKVKESPDDIHMMKPLRSF